MVLVMGGEDVCVALSKVKVIVLDLDRTIWSHPDVTSLVPPYDVTDDSLVDSRGEYLKLNECVRQFLDVVKSKGRWVLAIVSWNKPRKAEEVLDLLKLAKYFDIKVIEYHPRKDVMFEKLLQLLHVNGLDVKPEDMMYIDDNSEMITKVQRRFPKINAYLYRSGLFCDLLKCLTHYILH